MSSLIVLQDKHNVILASDTASSININNTRYRASDNEKKIFTIGNYKVFASGQKHLRDLFICLVCKDDFLFTPETAEAILKTYFTGIDDYCLEVVIAEKLSDSTCLYFLSSYNNFSIETNESSVEDISIFTGGVLTNIMLETFENEYGKNGNFKKSIISCFARNQCEEVGGSVEIHSLGSDKYEQHALPSIQLNRIGSNPTVDLIVGERIIGKILMGNRLIIEDEDGLIRLSGSKQEIFDPEGKARVVLGNFDEDKYGMKIDSGALEIINGLDDSHLNPDLIEDLKDDSELRADLRLESPLPNNITLNQEGITARTTLMPNHFARLDYRGLYVQGGALDLRTSEADNRGVNITGTGISAYNSKGERTFFLDTEGNMTSTSGTTEDLRTSITKTAEEIRLEASESNKILSDGIAENKASIITTASSIRLEVSNTIERLDGRIDKTNTAILQTEKDINLSVDTKLTNLETQIKTDTSTSIELSKTGILSTVKVTTDDLDKRISSSSSSISQLAGQITAKADSTTVNALGTRVSNVEWDMSAVDGKISQKVSQTDYNGVTIMSMVNQTASSYKIQAKNIQLDGITEVSSRLNIGSSGSFGEKNIIFNNGSSVNVYNSLSMEVTTSGNLYLGASTIRFDSYYGGVGSDIDFSTARSIQWGRHAPDTVAKFG